MNSTPISRRSVLAACAAAVPALHAAAADAARKRLGVGHF